MNKQLSTFFSATVLLVAAMFCGIGIHHTITTAASSELRVASESTRNLQSAACSSSAEFITGPLTANIGELCVFKLNDPTAKADWVIVPPATAYIDSSGSSFVFASNVPAKYTIIAAIVEDGQPKILTHVCEYGTSPEPNPSPKPNPTPPATLKDWVAQNVPAEGKAQATALAVCYEAVADSINKETIKTADAAFALLRSATQTKIKTNVWKPFLDELSVKVTESINSSTDIKTLGNIFTEIAAGLKAVSDKTVSDIIPDISADESSGECIGGTCPCSTDTQSTQQRTFIPYRK